MIRVKVGGVAATIQAMRLVRTTEQAVKDRVVEAAGSTLLRYVRMTGGIKDGHGQPELDALDNPYATRHGSIQEAALGHTGWWVHSQSGQLLRALRGAPMGASYLVFADTSVAPHAQAVIQGTRVMFARDFIWITANLRPVRIEMMRAMVRVLGKELRTKAHVRFSDGMGVSLSPGRDGSGKFTKGGLPAGGGA
jgi:hypothetical protein